MAADVRLALVDDSPLFSRGLQLLLPEVTESRVRVVAATDDAALAGGMVRQHRPDLAVVDCDMPALAGLHAIRAIRRGEPGVPVLAMGTSAGHDDGEGHQAMAALEAGASGYVRKTTRPEEFVSPLLAAVDGWAVVPVAVIHQLLSAAQRSRGSDVGRRLTEDERQLWRMVAAGWTTQRISTCLHVSERSAKRLIAALLRRLGVHTRTEAATLAGQTGLMEEPWDRPPVEVRPTLVRAGTAAAAAPPVGRGRVG